MIHPPRPSGTSTLMPVSVPAVALRDGDVQRRFGVVNRTLRDQIERTALRRVVAEIDLNIVVARDALILAAAKAVERLDRRVC